MARYRKRSYTKHRLQYHLVWIPKYRKRVLRGKINRWWISEISVQEDHIHIIIQVNPQDSVSEVAHILKGGASRVIRKEFPELEEFLWRNSFWADGYFAETIGNVDEEVVSKYIREQQE
jgi:putative transposase